jgi:ATP-dependent Clp protease protease subunit
MKRPARTDDSAVTTLPFTRAATPASPGGSCTPVYDRTEPGAREAGRPRARSEPSMPVANVTYQRTREMTIDELLLENRIVFLVGEINHASAARVMMQMLYLENQKRGQEINFYINSPGGAVDDTLAVYDTMRFISAPVATYCIGRAYSGAAVLLASGEKNKRYILPHAKVMIHQPWSQGIGGQASDVEIEMKEILREKRRLNEILARHTGKTVEAIARDSDRDFFMGAEDAVKYGLVDKVMVARESS